MQTVASDFDPIPNTDHIYTPKKVWGKELKREAISFWARYHHRVGLPIQLIGVCPTDGIYEIHRENSPGKKYKAQQLKENAFARELNHYAAEFQKELCKVEPIGGIVGTVTVPDDIHAVEANDNYSKLRDSTTNN